MDKKRYVIGLDLGTTSAKAVIFKKDGSVVSEAEQTYPFLDTDAAKAEQDPLAIENAAIEAIRRSLVTGGISGDEVLSVGLSSAMHSLICVDENNEPLSSVITWADRRSAEQATRLKMSTEGTEIYQQSGTPIHPMSPLAKLIWMRETAYGPYERASKFLSIKEFLTSRWFGVDAVDYSVASATGLFDIKEMTWNEQALNVAGIDRSQLSTPVAPTYVFHGLDARVSERTGLRVDVPFVAGASDGPLANLGIGAINPGETAITIGTSGAIRQMANRPNTDEQQNVFCYGVTEDLWILGGPTNNGAIVLQWLKDTLGEKEVEEAAKNGDDAFTLLTARAEQASPGSNGLLFLPYLNGERAPHWDANARGSYIGLSMDHRKEHFLRAGMEGVMFNLYNIHEAVGRLVGETTSLYANGGFARSPFWVQMLADMFGQDVHLPSSHQSAAWGAAWFSMLAIGEVRDLASIKEYIPMQGKVTPHADTSARYRELYGVYRNIYETLKPTFDALQRVQQ
ncbi:gluconokinase [Texcoconibacillus texcoconensis]|uniref:Gluconokinase n=1 Tax=Texcoconibacillus texcoconensis TaxID=1095777 RepID=A0A840QQW9_9BACI|nr:gluconokinase [Texcoconibacillus texcoconensis]MBB5173846.1 gluconokinase [Texcoconibacillus texcoconensis]